MRRIGHNFRRLCGISWGRGLAILTLLVGTTVAWLWPLPKMVDTHYVRAPYWWDAELNTYILAQARRNLVDLLHGQPHLLDAHILHPMRDVLAYSENLLTIAAASFLVPAGDGVFALHNLMVIVCIAANAITTYVYLRARPLSVSAALLGAFLFTYAPFRLGLLGRIQLVGTMLIPLVLLAFERALAKPTFPRWMAALGLWALQLGVGIYYGVYLVVLLAPVVGVLVFASPDTRHWRALLSLGAATAIVGSIVLLLFRPYLDIAADMGFERNEAWVQGTSGVWADLRKTSTMTLHWRFLAEEVIEGSAREPISFPGAVAPFFGLLGIAFGLGTWLERILSKTTRLKRARNPDLGAPGFRFGVGAHLFWLVLSLWLFFGEGKDAPLDPPFNLYHLLREHMPGMRGLRYPSRFIMPATFALATLAAYGANALLADLRAKSRNASVFVAALLPVLALVDTWTQPLPMIAGDAPGAAYHVLAEDQGAEALAELPLDPTQPHEPRIAKVIGAALHGLPVLNGYSGFDPPSIVPMIDLLSGFPDDTSHRTLRSLGVNRVLARGHVKSAAEAAIRAGWGSWLRKLYEGPDGNVYAITDTPRGRVAAVRSAVRAFRNEQPFPARVVPASAMRLSSVLNTVDLPNLLDSDPETAWSTGSAQQANVPWVTIDFDRPRRISALWLDGREEPAELPRGIRVQIKLADGSWRVVREETPHLPIGALLAAPKQTIDVIRFAPVEARGIELRSMVRSSGTPGTLQNLWVEEGP